ncbi:DUF4258 domain-containing protein [Aurantibacter crassamenti]|uniref:DUF4258 domain-containing protein n=1 Tax=Aurantibacter crassamenti TaxID=1837375 RepID=UPI0019397FE6|nr:DUF4258 domain-containing protein [Aurantibacter crassamenti]MBM1106977.1 DUF4258 domain-containing protein [Aurantibacter crassamenti]
MAFIKRLGFYLFGLSIGLIFLSIFLRKKADETGVEFCYFPNCRALKDMRSKSVNYSDELSAMIQNNEIDTLQIKQFFREGEINFGKSETKTKPCKRYLIENSIDGVQKTLTVKNCTEKIIIESIQ